MNDDAYLLPLLTEENLRATGYRPITEPVQPNDAIVRDMMMRLLFDPNGPGYDYANVPPGTKRVRGHLHSAAPLTPQMRQAWPDLPEDTSLILKGAAHPTWTKEMETPGREVIEAYGRYFSVPR